MSGQSSAVRVLSGSAGAAYHPAMSSSAGTRFPSMDPYSRHVLVCVGGYCSPDHRGEELYRLLPSLLQREGLLFGPHRVKRGETPCLGECAGEPIVKKYPDGVWYGGVTPAKHNRIVVEHLRDGRIVEDAVFHRL